MAQILMWKIAMHYNIILIICLATYIHLYFSHIFDKMQPYPILTRLISVHGCISIVLQLRGSNYKANAT